MVLNSHSRFICKSPMSSYDSLGAGFREVTRLPARASPGAADGIS